MKFLSAYIKSFLQFLTVNIQDHLDGSFLKAPKTYFLNRPLTQQWESEMNTQYSAKVRAVLVISHKRFSVFFVLSVLFSLV